MKMTFFGINPQHQIYGMQCTCICYMYMYIIIRIYKLYGALVMCTLLLGSQSPSMYYWYKTIRRLFLLPSSKWKWVLKCWTSTWMKECWMENQLWQNLSTILHRSLIFQGYQHQNWLYNDFYNYCISCRFLCVLTLLILRWLYLASSALKANAL